MDFVAPDLDFVAAGLDFGVSGLDFGVSGLETSGAIAAAKSATTAALFTLERVGRPCSRQNRAAQ